MGKQFNWFIMLMTATSFCHGQSSTLNRPFDPVVLQGSILSSYFSAKPDSIVAFKYTSAGWVQIPTQADERALLDIVKPYGPYAADKGYPPPTGVNIYFYTDAGTYTGADPNVLFDADDELVFMVKDAGGKFNGTTQPAGTIAGSCTEVSISDPLGGLGYVYLFQSAGSLLQSAGASYVSYSFQLSNGGTYPQNFSFLNARNNENSWVTTSNYSWHFAAEWISDELKITTGGAPNTDILDRHKNFFTGSCVRSEDSFSEGDNAFVANKTGAIRAIRSYMGANSGPLTQRTHLFYQGRQDITTDLRVHNIGSINDVFDYNSNSNGMKYRNNLNTGGASINGSKDVVTAGDITWEMVSGSKGAVVILLKRTTTMAGSEAVFSSYYDDNKTKPESKCTGDGQAWGTSGPSITFNSTVCTEPVKSSCAGTANLRFLSLQRQIYFESPAATLTTATTYHNQSNNPLQITTNSCSASPRWNTELIQPVVHAPAFIYPNPAKEYFTVNYQNGMTSGNDVTIVNSLGQTVMQKMFAGQQRQNLFTVNISNLIPGLYHVVIRNGNQSSTQKLIVR